MSNSYPKEAWWWKYQLDLLRVRVAKQIIRFAFWVMG